MDQVEMFHAYNAPVSEGTRCLEPKVTRDSDTEGCDINRIVARAEKTGLLPDFGRGPGQFADVSEMGDYRTALHTMEEAEAAFMALPYEVRRHFDHDPVSFLDACTDPARLPELEQLGLVAPKEAPAPVEPAAATS